MARVQVQQHTALATRRWWICSVLDVVSRGTESTGTESGYTIFVWIQKLPSPHPGEVGVPTVHLRNPMDSCLGETTTKTHVPLKLSFHLHC